VPKLLVAHDIGRAINPTTVEGQLEGRIVQGIGYALTEDYFSLIILDIILEIG